MESSIETDQTIAELEAKIRGLQLSNGLLALASKADAEDLMKAQHQIRILTKGIHLARVALLETSPCAHEECKQPQTEAHRIALEYCDKVLEPESRRNP